MKNKTKLGSDVKFSDELEAWLRSEEPNNLDTLSRVFGPRAFATIFVIFMAVPALPLPTGGAERLLGIVVMLLSLEMVIGLKVLWLPRWVRVKKIGKTLEEKGIPFLIKKVRWLEKFSRPRLSSWVENDLMIRVMGLIIFVLTLATVTAVPYTGLDTLPALGVVLISLGMILGDILGLFLGILSGGVGILLIYLSLKTSTSLFKKFFW